MKKYLVMADKVETIRKYIYKKPDGRTITIKRKWTNKKDNLSRGQPGDRVAKEEFKYEEVKEFIDKNKERDIKDHGKLSFFRLHNLFNKKVGKITQKLFNSYVKRYKEELKT